MADDLEARLESHAQAFEGLLSLIPAKDYYGQDNSDQWQRKKQTKEEKQAARRAKLDPANRKSAMDVINENERKRKRELGIEDEGEIEQGAAPLPRQIKKAKQAITGPSKPAEQGDAGRTKAEKRKEKRERQKEKTEKKKAKVEAKKARKEAEKIEGGQSGEILDVEEREKESEDDADEVEGIDLSGLADEHDDASTAPTSPNLDSPPFDISANQSTASSASSITPAVESAKTEDVPLQVTKTHPEPSATSERQQKQKAFTLPEVDSEKLHARLKARIDELRAKRKADGADGQPARSRQELLESRRKRSEARKKHKKEVRAQAKAEEERVNQERLQGSGSPLSADIFSPRSPMTENNYAFGRVAFEDGTAADAGLSGLQDARQKKGPRDLKGALEVARKKEDRLKQLDEVKRNDIEEKDVWLNAKKKAHGERVRDDTSLLKKALKRKEKQKSKSEKAWQEREDGIKKGQALRQKKREDNLAKRREEKGAKGKKVKGKPSKKKGRPGFQ